MLTNKKWAEYQRCCAGPPMRIRNGFLIDFCAEHRQERAMEKGLAYPEEEPSLALELVFENLPEHAEETDKHGGAEGVPLCDSKPMEAWRADEMTSALDC